MNRWTPIFWIVVLGMPDAVWSEDTPTEKAEKEFKVAVENARKTLVAKLAAELQTLTKKGDLDGAVKLRDLLKVYAPEEPGKQSEEIDLGKTATYKTSSNWNKIKPSLNLLNGVGGGYAGHGEEGTEFAFCTNEESAPFIVIDLTRTCAVSKVIIQNRKGSPHQEDLAATLTMYAGQSPTGPWQAVWKADKAQAEWSIDTKVTTRFIKLGLKDRAYFHLRSVELKGR